MHFGTLEASSRCPDNSRVMRDNMNPPRRWQNVAPAVLTFAAVLLLSGCNMLSTKANTTSTNGTGGQTLGHVGLSASSLDFGNVTVGSTKTMSITLTNSTATGGPSVTVSQVSASGTGFSISSSSSASLAPGQSTNISVMFKPTAAGSASGNLTIDVVGASDPGVVPLDGTGTSNTAGAQLSVSPTTLSFGSVTIGNSKALTGSIQAANSDVTVASASWNGTGYTVSGITFPVTVKAGTSASFTVTFAPQSTGSIPGNISFVSNAANSPTAETFSGTGAQAAVQHTVSLNWTPSTSTVIGYNVYRGTTSGGPYTRVNSSLRTTTNYSDGTVQSGQVYYYVATSVDSNADESSFSGEATAVVPSP